MTNAPLPGPGGVCTICDQPVEPEGSAQCNACGEPFHLVLTRDGDGRDCGEVWINEEFLALEFGCARCLAEHRGQAAPPRPTDQPGRSRIKHTGASARDIVRRKRR